jgi:hypothetical protein
MPIFDELEGLLGAETLAKLTPELRAKLEFGDELTSYYNGDTQEQPRPRSAAARTETAPGTTTTPNFDLAALDALFDKKLGELPNLVKTQVDEAVKSRGNELFTNAVATSMQNSRELIRIEGRHERDFGAPLDETAFDAFVTAGRKAGKQFTSVSQAYDDFTRDKYTEKTVAERVRDELKTRASQQGVPGYTPPSATAPHRILAMRGKSEGGGVSAVNKAAEALAALRQAHAS